MARYTVPKVYYQSSINANTAVEVAHIKSLTWANRTNNNGNFELTIPMDSFLTPFNPVVGGYIRLSPGDTIMKIEKRYKICDEKGNFRYKLGGRTTQRDDDTVRNAKNTAFYFRYIFNGVNAEQYSTFKVDTPVATINKGDILHSSTYEDNLGGFTETVMTAPGSPEKPGYSWGTIVTGLPKVIVSKVNKSVVISVTIGSNAMVNGTAPGQIAKTDPRAGTQESDIVTTQSDSPFTTDNVLQISEGQASGQGGRMDRVVYSGSWVKNDVTSDTVMTGPWHYWRTYDLGLGWLNFQDRGQGIISVRTITLKTEQEYLAEMQAFLNGIQNRSGTVATVPTVPPTFKTTYVQGGHAGYSFSLKSKVEVEKRYKVDFNLGDTISVDDTRLNVVYTGVVSGAVETIDSNGYNVDIEIGTLGATLEQRVQKVI